MSVVAGIIAFFFIIALLILVHELGHFTFAKLLGVRVDEFGLGFPPRLKSWYRGGTRYSINAIPLGGFVRMPGENGESSTPDSFGAKAPWRRFVILAAGPSMNLLLAIIIFFIAFLWGTPRGLTVVTGIAPGSPAAFSGLRPHDTIVAIDGTHVTYIDQLLTLADDRLGKAVNLQIRRHGSTFDTTLVPRLHPPANQGPIGITLGDTATIRYAPAPALGMAFEELGGYIQLVPQLLGDVARHNTQDLSGPIGIAQDTTAEVQAEPGLGPGSLLMFVALLSASLGVLNLLPIPALDGGRIVFVVLSWIRRRSLSPELEGVIHMAGMAALLMLILFVSYQDVARLFGGSS